MQQRKKSQKPYQRTSYGKKQAVIYKTPKADLKYTDYSQSNVAVTSSGTFYSLLANLVRGDNGLNNFGGNNIYPKYIQCDWHMNTNQNYNSARVMIFQWEDGAVPSLSALLANTATGIATISPPNVSAKAQLKVLYDAKVIFAPTAGDGSTVLGQGIASGSCYIPEKKLKPVRYTSTTNSIADNAIFMLVISDDSAPTYPAIFFHTRVAFTDRL